MFIYLSTTIKVQTDSAISSAEDMLTETQVIRTNIELNNNSTFVDKSTSTLSQELKSVKSAVTKSKSSNWCNEATRTL